MSLLGGNGLIFVRRWPELWQSILATPPARSLTRRNDTPEPTLVIDGLHVTSGYDRLREARRQAEAGIPATAHEAWVYGFALGDLPRVLFERHSLERLHVVILSARTTLASLEQFDHCDWLDDPRLELVRAAEVPRLGTPFAAAPACLRLADDDALPLRDAVVAALNRPHAEEEHERTLQRDRPLLDPARPLFARAGDVATLFGSRPAADVIVAGGGPTLTSELDWLRARRSATTLVAVSTALVPLQQAGLTPDLVLAIDPHPRMVRHLDGVDRAALRDVPLVTTPLVSDALRDAWPGPQLLAYTRGWQYAELRRLAPRGELFDAGSVIHPAIDLAVRLGARSVTLLGADFCYPDARSHAAGATLGYDVSNRARLTVINGYGERVRSDINLCQYLRAVERYVALHAQVDFRKRGRAGAELAGVEWDDD